jgi:hypothetical protein
VERFWEKVSKQPGDGCWFWTSALDAGGYPILWIGGGRSVRAHRFAYGLIVGPIPDGLTLDHLCRVRHCVNPSHLEPCTAGENAKRSPNAPYNVKAASDRCARSHLFDEQNTALHNGRRECRACAALKARERRAAKTCPDADQHRRAR